MSVPLVLISHVQVMGFGQAQLIYFMRFEAQEEKEIKKSHLRPFSEASRKLTCWMRTVSGKCYVI